MWLDIGITNIHTAFLGPQLWDKVKMFNSEVAGAGGWSGGEAAYSSSDHSNSPTQFQQVNYPKLFSIFPKVCPLLPTKMIIF